MALTNFSWVVPDMLAGSDIPGRGSGNDAQLWNDCEFLHAQGVRMLVSLEHPGGSMKHICKAIGIRWIAFPIPDFGAPPLDGQFAALVDGCVDACRSGQPVCVHCRAGIGRTGMVLTCIYGRLAGVDADTAVQYIRSRRTAIESTEQHEFVRDFFRKYPAAVSGEA